MPLIAALPWSPAFQALLDGLGKALDWLYDLIPNYGVSIILLTVAVRLVLLPLGVKQIRSMHAMQAIQPKVKAVQQKYKGNRQKQNEEMMKLYREHGVNPLSGCWPMLLQFPILIALYAVLRYPQHPPHLPEGSELRNRIERQFRTGEEQGTDFLWMNPLCSAQQAGQDVTLPDPQAGRELKLDCGEGAAVRIPYYVLAALMIGTTYYQQRQMQKATPGGGQQQQMLMRMMPILFGVWGFFFPAGLVLYWTTSNLWQIGQQHFMLTAGGSLTTAGAGTPSTDAKPGAKKGPPVGGSSARPRAAQEKRSLSGPVGGSGSGGKDAGDRKKRRKR